MKIGMEGLTKPLPENHWIDVAQKLYEKDREVPSALRIRADAILLALGLPTGQYSALETDKNNQRLNPEKDAIVAKYITNIPGVSMNENPNVISRDFRDIYPDGIPHELASALDPETLNIMQAEFEHLKYIKNEYGETKDLYETDRPINYFRLPGGVDVFLKSYRHAKAWQDKHKDYLKEINKNAKVICVEGSVYKPFGESLVYLWSDPDKRDFGHYDYLMRDAVDAGFSGKFAEIDARYISKIKMDSPMDKTFPELPNEFFEKYLNYLKKEDPVFGFKLTIY